MYYNAACQITGSHKIYTNKPIKVVKPFHLFSNGSLKLVLLPGTYFAHSWHEALVWMTVATVSKIHNQLSLQLPNMFLFHHLT